MGLVTDLRVISGCWRGERAVYLEDVVPRARLEMVEVVGLPALHHLILLLELLATRGADPAVRELFIGLHQRRLVIDHARLVSLVRAMAGDPYEDRPPIFALAIGIRPATLG